MASEQIDQYIQRARQTGMSDEQIKSELIKAGWQEAQLQDTFSSSAQIGGTVPKKFPVLKTSIVVAGLFILGGGTYAAYNYFSSVKTESALIPTQIPPATEEETNIIANTNVPKNNSRQEEDTIIRSRYGFNFTIPNGWHIWEGASAANALINETDFIADLENVSNDSSESADFSLYQKFMNSWKVESASSITLTNATFDYSNRDLANAVKIQSTLIASEENLSQGATEINVSNSNVDYSKEEVSNDEREIRYISIDGKDALLQIGKQFNVVDLIIVSIPLQTSQQIDESLVKSISIVKDVRKDDPSALPELLDFISKLKLTVNQ